MNGAPLNDSDVNNRIKNLEKNIRKRTFSDMLAGTIIYFFPIIIFIIIFPAYFLLEYLLHEDVTNIGTQQLLTSIQYFSAFAILFYFVIAFIISTFYAFKRTHYKGFLWESLNEFELLLSGTLLIAIFTFQIEVIFLPLSLFCFFILPVYIRNHLKKPLILKSFSSNFEKDNLGIIMKQSLYVSEFADGYSSRPVFDNIAEFIKNFGDENLLRKKVQEYAHYLAQNGDLIGLDLVDNKLIMYLRTNLYQFLHIENPLTTIKKLKIFINKRNLTSIAINLTDWEISFRLNEYDYKILGNITYHQFSERILEQFANSLNEFVKGNIEESQNIINPPIYHENYYTPGQKPAYFIGIFYLMGMIIVGYSLLFNSTPLYEVEFLDFIWPLILLPNLVNNPIIGIILLFLICFTSVLVYKSIILENSYYRRN